MRKKEREREREREWWDDEGREGQGREFIR